MTNLNHFKKNREQILQENTFYNPEYKLEFLDKHSDKLQDFNFYYRLFSNTKETEEELGRDLYDFSKVHIEDVISQMNPSTSSAASKIIAMIKRYLTHAARDGEKMSNIVQINGLTSLANSFMPDNPKFYISESELQLLEDSCVNTQDAFIFRSVFEGISGFEMNELRNLKIKDIDQDKCTVSINIEGYDKNRTVRVSERFVDLAVKAHHQQLYVLNNGEELSENYLRNNSAYDLEESDYIMKKSKIGRIILDAPITTPTLYKRFSNIKSFQSFSTIDKYYLKFNNIYKSGALYAAAKYIEENDMDIEVMTTQQWTQVRNHVKNSHRNLPATINNLVNAENIKELYFIDEL